MRGFQSSVDYRLYFGLGNSEEIDSVKIIWSDNKVTLLNSPKINNHIMLDKNSSKKVVLKVMGITHEK